MTNKKETQIAAQVETAETETAEPVKVKKPVQPPKFAIVAKKVLTIPLLKPSLDVPFYVRLTGKIFTGKKIEHGEQAKMEAAELVHCANLETGENQQLIVPAVLQSIFDENYPDQSYVGLCFMITKHPKPSGKSYSPFSVTEIADPANETAE